MNTQLLLDLLDAYGPSGREQQVRTIIHKEIDKLVDEVTIDKFGNLIAHKKGNGPKVLITAHMDEIGLMVRGITEEGHIHFTNIGGVEPITLPGQTVCILGKTNKCLSEGIISCKEMQNDTKLKAIPELKDFYVDIGLEKEEVEKKGIAIGDYVIPKHRATFLGSKEIICGKAVDNRAGCFVLIELLRHLKKIPYDLYCVFTVQEEIGLYGAKIASYVLDPDWGLAIDVTNTEDAEGKDKGVTLGQGPTIEHMDTAIIANTCLTEWLQEAAKKAKVPLQNKVEVDGMTDAASIMFSKGGIPATSFSIPVRNLHSTVSICSIKDIEEMIEVLKVLLETKQTKCLV